ncbi:MAG TPA: DUF6350 family protein [Mycobacteriales bacterium]|nr:DUF6350 family protein [Mycobacteriales bacterium]
MTELLTRPRAAYDDVADRSSVWWRGALAALWAVAVGVASLLVIALIAWAADSRTGASAGQAVRAALQIWLVAQRVPLRVPGGSIALSPLLLTLALAFLVARSAAVLARGQDIDAVRDVARIAVAVGVPYGVLTTFVAAAANSSSVRPSPAAALVCGSVLGVLAGGWGAARGGGLVRATADLLPDLLRAPLVAGAVAFAVLLAGATLLLSTALVLHIAEATGSADALGGGAVAGVALAALTIALIPNAALCTVGYLAGPGFAVGAGATVTLTGARPGPLPTFPLMAAVPAGPAPMLVELLGIAILVCAGVAAAWLVAREGRSLLPSMWLAAGAGAATGLLTAIAVTLADGPAGPGRMTVLGASPWQTGLAVAGEVAAVACGAAGALTWRRGR